jgi:hypothetical protein
MEWRLRQPDRDSSSNSNNLEPSSLRRRASRQPRGMLLKIWRNRRMPLLIITSILSRRRTSWGALDSSRLWDITTSTWSSCAKRDLTSLRLSLPQIPLPRVSYVPLQDVVLRNTPNTLPKHSPDLWTSRCMFWFRKISGDNC